MIGCNSEDAFLLFEEILNKLMVMQSQPIVKICKQTLVLAIALLEFLFFVWPEQSYKAKALADVKRGDFGSVWKNLFVLILEHNCLCKCLRDHMYTVYVIPISCF